MISCDCFNSISHKNMFAIYVHDISKVTFKYIQNTQPSPFIKRVFNRTCAYPFMYGTLEKVYALAS